MAVSQESKAESAALNMRTDLEETQLRLVEIGSKLAKLQKIRVSDRSQEQKDEILELQEDRTNFAEAVKTLGDGLQLLASTPASATRTSVPSAAAKELKFPPSLVYFEEGKTLLAKWFVHTERVLQTSNFPLQYYVNALMHQCSKDSAVLQWVGDTIADQGLSWDQAKICFTKKYGTVCVEEQHLSELWALRWREFISMTAFLSAIAICCQGAGIALDQYWVVSFALAFMNPAVAALVRFGKRPSYKMTWSELAEAVRDQEHNMRVGVVAPNFNPKNGRDRHRRDRDKDDSKDDNKQISQPLDAATDAKFRKDDWKLRKTCHLCGEKGHISPECPRNRPGPPVSAQLLVAAEERLDVDAALRDMCGLTPSGGTVVVAV